MRLLFIHNNFPAQFRHVAQALARNPENRIGFITQNRTQEMPGVTKLIFEPARKARAGTHQYVRQFENAVLEGQAVFRVLQQLKSRGFVPDLVCAHTGWGAGMFVKDIYPDTPLLLHCEWYTRSRGSDLDFDPAYPPDINDMLRYRVSNAAMLVDLDACDGGVSPTHWQRSRFPEAFRPRIDVLHEGIDTAYFAPQPGAKPEVPGLDLSSAREIVTYSARGMDAYRGFPQFIEALGHLLERRPQCHAVIVGEDRVAYGPPPPEGNSYKEWMLAKVPLDSARVHFAGKLPYGLYRQVLRASSVHVYLTRPFVLSWSLLEAMATGCLIVASDTAPVREVMEDGVNGLLVDFFDARGIAGRIEEALEQNERLAHLRERARQTVLERYALAELLPRHLHLLERYAQGQNRS
jgi:glycosyltransferase involved in cell wall biosynthesis